MTSEPVLMPPRDDKPFIVKTDGASTLGIGGVLTQKDDGRERVVAYYGRALQAAEKNWTVTEIELLAALESIRNKKKPIFGLAWSSCPLTLTRAAPSASGPTDMATETPPSPKRPRDPSSDNKVSQRATSFDPVWPERQIVTTGH
eukprot:scaffold14629_cov116-Isochrysis_galbana.AAC.4